MPLQKSNPDRYREVHREAYAEKYREDEKFRKAEGHRKASWYWGKSTDPAWRAERAAKERARRAAAKKVKM